MKRRALLIGINSYHMLADLKYARRDAEAFGSALREVGGFDPNFVTLMTCQAEGGLRANSRYIEYALNDIQKERDLDLLIVGFWGHGFAPRSGQRYLCGVETSEDDLERTAVSLDLVRAKLTQVQARDTLIILDCCQNQPSGRSADAESLSQGEEKVLNSMARDIQLARMDDEPLSVPTVAVLSACREGQKAYEWDARSHGIFTAHLLDGLREGVRSVAQLSNHTFDRVVRTTNELHRQRQTPYFTIEGRGDILLTQQASAPQSSLPPQLQPTLPERQQQFSKPPPREKPKRQWWVVVDGDEQGPLSTDDITSLIDEGKLIGKSEVWQEGLNDWTTASSVAELKALLDVRPPACKSIRPSAKPALEKQRTERPFQLAEFKNLRQYALSEDGLNLDEEEATEWAEQHMQFFREHDFAEFKNLRQYAISGNGLDLDYEEATEWAKQHMPFFREHDFAEFKNLRQYALSGNGLDLDYEEATEWALKTLESNLKGKSQPQ